MFDLPNSSESNIFTGALYDVSEEAEGSKKGAVRKLIARILAGCLAPSNFEGVALLRPEGRASAWLDPPSPGQPATAGKLDLKLEI
jgi:hypothetical protein